MLIRTGWDARWGSERYWEPGPYLADESIDRIVRGGARLVGVDFWNVDDQADDSRPAHTRLLREGILIVGSDARPYACSSRDLGLPWRRWHKVFLGRVVACLRMRCLFTSSVRPTKGCAPNDIEGKR